MILSLQYAAGAKVEGFPDGESARDYEGCIVECAWDREAGVWNFLRTRTDKQMPNAYHVYEKVMQSIDDNITEEDLLAAIDEALREPIYANDLLQEQQRQEQLRKYEQPREKQLQDKQQNA